ncbi:asparagine synthase (glutamine-hydrolyzing) [Ruminococcaceae bacterium OttesenSCG-928-O06]|nr:asparagine synthase (glutamine-hydrolyzing) [Ruminococcaceae bacterium OttesenSCG-928-O06]
MCGIVGFTGGQPAEEKKRILVPMMERIVHRGPDMEGQYADEVMALGFRRLSIIDLSAAAAQPMFNEDGTVVVVFNGEVYNFMALREQLQAAGHVFCSGTDTEVIVHGYEEWGEGLAAKLRGMFSFVVWDIKTQIMLAARDPFGIKPFYYGRLSDGGLIFGSEIKSFLDHPAFVKELNPDALRPYLTFQYAAGDATFFKGVTCLPQGHYCVWQHGEMHTECYYDVDFAPDESLSFEESSDLIDAAVHESVAAHRISDVPVGAFLSGGVDSSYITACLLPENSFSVGFAQNEEAPDKFDETSYAASLSEKLGVKNYTKHITADECFAAFPDIQYHMDQPQSNPSSVPLWFLAKLAKEQVTVVLSGEGADEIFAGYELYADTPAMARFKKLPRGVRRVLGSIAAALPAFKGRNFLLKSAERPESWFIGQANVFPEKEAEALLQPAYRGGPAPLALAAPYYRRVTAKPEVSKKQYLDLHLWLPGDILLKADKMCMAHSLELRVPYLDREVMDLAARIPARYNIQGVENKVAFRRAAGKTLPDEWASRPKKGFPVPIRQWLRQEKYAAMVREYFASDYAAEFFEREKLLRLLDDHQKGVASNARKIWTVFTFLVWYKCFFIDEPAKT